MFLENAECVRQIAQRLPYKDMLKASVRKMSDLGESTFPAEPTMDAATLLKLQVRARARARAAVWRWG